jgi:hypothetical protein
MQLGKANLGDEGDEGKGPSSLEPRVGAVVGGCREMQLGKANLGDEGDEGKEPSSLEPRVGAVVGVERCNLGKQILATRVAKAKDHRRWSRVWERWWVSRGATGGANLGDGGDEVKEPSSLRPRAVGDDTGGGAEILADSEIW